MPVQTGQATKVILKIARGQQHTVSVLQIQEFDSDPCICIKLKQILNCSLSLNVAKLPHKHTLQTGSRNIKYTFVYYGQYIYVLSFIMSRLYCYYINVHINALPLYVDYILYNLHKLSGKLVLNYFTGEAELRLFLRD